MKPDDKRQAIAQRASTKPGEKIKRDAFLYLEDTDGDPDNPNFAQCGDCCFRSPDGQCAVIGIDVSKGWSCGVFLDGPWAELPIRTLISAEAAGLVKRPVRCENCFYGGTTCGLYDRLNKEFPELFDLDSKIKPKACCNANTPKGGKSE